MPAKETDINRKSMLLTFYFDNRAKSFFSKILAVMLHFRRDSIGSISNDYFGLYPGGNYRVEEYANNVEFLYFVSYVGE